MPKIIKDQQIIDDTRFVANEENADYSDANCIPPLAQWSQEKNKTAVFLTGGDELDELETHLNQLQLIAIEFPAFTDGRGYSLAKRLRNQGFEGDIRAVGDVLVDQLFFMQRCGFSSYQMANEADNERALNHFQPFTEVYQTSATGPQSILQQRLES